MFAQVFIDTNANSIDSIYDYRVPEEMCALIKPGMRVIVPFGNGNRKYQALVVSLSDNTAFDETKVKPIDSFLDIEPVVPLYLIETAVFLRNRYFCTYSEALNTVLPSIDKIKRLTVYHANKTNLSLSENEQKVYDAVALKDGCDATRLKIRCGLSAEETKLTLSSLLQKNAVYSDDIFDAAYKKAEDVYIELLNRDETVENLLLTVSKRAEKQKAVVMHLFLNGGSCLRSELYEATKANSETLSSLAQKGILRLVKKERSFDMQTGIKKTDPPLTAEQNQAIEEYRQKSDCGSKNFLLFGVTGSGKTRVFFDMFDKALEEGKQCLLLVPEIALTPQMMRLVSERFDTVVAIMHSQLSAPERYAEFLKIKRGEARIVLGARSALFMPFKELGLVVIDEEHETSYKSSQSPRYDAIETAEYICSLTGAKLVLSSATPSTATFYKAARGEYEVLKLKNRVNNIPMPHITVSDMRVELKSGNRTPISRPLKEKIEQRLASGEQVLLFLNRRGYNTYVFCRSCGYIEMCPNCEVSLTYHRESGRLICHYCGYNKKIPSVCPSCGSEKIKFMGTGTEKIEQVVREMFPEARVMRLDSDVARTKDAYEKILGDFAAGKADILIGTQMIVKGLDFEKVTLTGILLADASLNFPDINAASRTYQLTSQAAGRSGRREKPGHVVIQTYMPQAPPLVYCAANDYEGFYAYDIAHRMEMSYPPFTEILGLFTANADSDTALNDSVVLAKEVNRIIKQNGYDKIKLYAPSPAFIQKLKNKYIFHTLVCYPFGSDFPKDFRKEYDKIKKKLHSTVFVEINPITLL